MENERQIRLADAAIHLLGSQGSRGLTHRAVDAVAGLPMGSTSFYCRTRAELLELALRRHASLDMQDLEEDNRRFGPVVESRAVLIDRLVHRVSDWLSSSKRVRLIARFELFLLASREQKLALVVNQQRARFLAFTAITLQHLGLKDHDRKAFALITMMDGLLLDQARDASEEISTDHLRAFFATLLSD